MQTTRTLIFLPLYFFANFALASDPCAHSKTAFRCVKYVKNYDADTITFNIPNVHPLLGEKISVRVNGVDTAELKTKNTCEKNSARIAKRLVENLLTRSNRIDLENIKRGKYFRIVADVIIDGSNLSNYLLKNNLAYRYSGGKKSQINWCSSNRQPTSDE